MSESKSFIASSEQAFREVFRKFCTVCSWLLLLSKVKDSSLKKLDEGWSCLEKSGLLKNILKKNKRKGLHSHFDVL